MPQSIKYEENMQINTNSGKQQKKWGKSKTRAHFQFYFFDERGQALTLFQLSLTKS